MNNYHALYSLHYEPIHDMLYDEYRSLSNEVPRDIQKKLYRIYKAAWGVFYADYLSELRTMLQAGGFACHKEYSNDGVVLQKMKPKYY